MYFHGWGFTWLIAVILGIIPFWRICTRVGFSPWLSLLIIVPLANIIFIYYIAFADWPIQKSSAAPG
jgi:heme/copper-type cytochrome/quinol oxidase subunit 4